MSSDFVPFIERRRRVTQAGQPEVYRYDFFPETLRAQINHVLWQAIGYETPSQLSVVLRDGGPSESEQMWSVIAEAAAEELGVAYLPGIDASTQVQTSIGGEDFDTTITVLEYACRFIDGPLRDANLRPHQLREFNILQTPDQAIERINERLLQNGVGYQFVNGQIIRVDSQLLHTETVVPALRLLQRPGFAGPEQEMQDGFDNLRHGHNGDAMNDALKAFESTMKVICDARGWVYGPGDTAKSLIKVLNDNSFFAVYHGDFTGRITGLLESGTPTNRNKNSGHGAGAQPRVIENQLAIYTLHLAAANIIFLVETHLANP